MMFVPAGLKAHTALGYTDMRKCMDGPCAYLNDVLTRMVEGHPVNHLDELLPRAWKPAIHFKT
ncbi:transposase domain-containing protein [Frankia sp. RB7]|nr:transposase domain-containing protein [Frankia sp. RB7]